jgi:DNA-binding CsgD family transcriptional regulator
MNTLGLAYQSMGQYDSALHWYRQALQLATTQQNVVWQGIVSGNMGAAYFEQGNDDLALPLLWKDYRLTLADEPNNAGNTLHRLALLYLRKGKSDSALLLARRTLHILTASSRVNPWFLRNGYKAMMEAYLKKDMSDSAFFYSDRYHHLNDSLIQWVAENRADLVQSRLEFEKKSNLINLLLQEKNAEQNRRNFLLAGIILLMITTWLYLRWQKQQHLNKQQQLQYGKEKAEAEIKNARLQLDEFTRNILAKNDLIEQLQQQLAQQHRQVNNELPGQTLLTENDWLRFKEMFDRANPGFLSGLQQQVPDITAAELRLAALMRLNLGNKHIASMLGIGSDAVRKTKSRLRQRLGITVEHNLDDYIRDLPLAETT